MNEAEHVVVTGGAGFIGAHLCEALLDRGSKVTCADNLCTSDGTNLIGLEARLGFSFLERDVCEGLDDIEHCDVVFHLASPASPPDYLRLPLQTLAAGSTGTAACLELAERCEARFVLASTSEVYGDPLVHPQPEHYWGNVNPVGPRSVYDEAKRFAEALTMAYVREGHLDAGIVRIFNTYGPRLRPGDGRVVSNFIVQALAGTSLTIYGDGTQTRSLCYVADLVEALIAMALRPGIAGPVNLGSSEELTVSELAQRIIALTGSSSKPSFSPLPVDDPTRRKPDIQLAHELLGWKPSTELDEGLSATIAWLSSHEPPHER
jgi:dTDP-glucose 4,6-dehydratase